MSTPRRKHRRVRNSWAGCGCPEGTRKVSTCKTGAESCKTGRGWGCLGIGKTAKGKRIPRWVAAVCSTPAPIVRPQPRSPRVKALKNGLAKGRKSSEFDQRELHAGERVEREHTSNPAVAQQIAMDHLVEDPHYYSKLLRAGL